MTSPDGSIFVIRYKTGEEDANEFHDPNQQQQQQHQHNHVHNQAHVAGTGGVGANADKDVINSFISGTQCLNGGTGWWKYEVCFGKHVIQYHEVYIFAFFFYFLFCIIKKTNFIQRKI